jgi:hypothetical protein
MGNLTARCYTATFYEDRNFVLADASLTARLAEQRVEASTLHPLPQTVRRRR